VNNHFYIVEIINRVRKGEDPPYRPYIPEDSIVPDRALNLMTSCWSEIPDESMKVPRTDDRRLIQRADHS
jgi:hypothetical protein